jgi:preprotein translocase subunit SecB
MTEAGPQTPQPVFNIEKLYVKDLSLEIPHAPHIFLERENPQMDMKMSTETEKIDDDVYEVAITATVTTKIGDKVMFLIEAKQAGIFRLSNLPGDDMEPVLAVLCPNIVFPYLRETVSSTAVRAGFAPVMLSPVNFDMIYQQHKMEKAKASAAAH